ncbi:MAG: DNA mismatch repair protein MutS [Alphaproteobacteria bacterium]|nr:DNA mismatch repair protein MutS [Alphaproteobacteria bacterium]
MTIMHNTITSENETGDDNGLTPMLVQYKREKAKHPECLLFFRLGDFYELFFEDAITAAAALQITLTQRGMHNNQPIPMCGVPFHAYEHYVKKLLQQGMRVAICEQTETPEDRKKNGGKGPLSREVVRVMTPGTVVEEAFLESSAHNFLLSVATGAIKSTKVANLSHAPLSCALLDLSTGTFILESCATMPELFNLLSRYTIAEFLVPDSLFEAEFDNLRPYHKRLMPLPALKYDVPNAKDRLHKIYDVATLESLGSLSDNDYAALGTLLDYVTLTQKDAIQNLPFPKRQDATHFLVLDHYTRANLEIDRSIRGTLEGSLLHALDHTITHGGGRLLQHRLACPIQDADTLNLRLDRVAFFLEHRTLRTILRDHLKRHFDMERACSRLVMGKGGPRDIGHILGGIHIAKDILHALSDKNDLPYACPIVPEILLRTLHSALTHTLPHLARDGGFIKDGYDEGLDTIRSLQRNAQNLLEEIQEKYRSETGITTLKIKTNNILGYFLECPPSQQGKIPDTFIHRQSLASALRYTTPELNTLASKLTSAAMEAIELELHIFGHLCDLIQNHQEHIKAIAAFLADIDVSTAMAHLAHTHNYARPIFTDATTLTIDKGRHPVLDSETFTPNDTYFSKNEGFFLITGPNMAGKSTYLRQVALITLMAQCGFYVPAQKAVIGIVDRIFSRIGAGDDLASGRSTFMVEMVETATILNQATPRSLVILDELGRGTSTYDGLSLALAVTEHLANTVQCRTLFATHYFELTDLEKNIPSLTNHQMGIKEYDGKILFLHTLEKGAANRSYGLHVAALSGVPKKIIARAEDILLELQTPHSYVKDERQKQQLALPFPHTLGRKDAEKDLLIDSFLSTLKSLDIHNLTPMKALTLLSDMKEKFG